MPLLHCQKSYSTKTDRERERERGRLDADGQRVCRQSNIVRSEGKRKGRKG